MASTTTRCSKSPEGALGSAWRTALMRSRVSSSISASSTLAARRSRALAARAAPVSLWRARRHFNTAKTTGRGSLAIALSFLGRARFRERQFENLEKRLSRLAEARESPAQVAEGPGDAARAFGVVERDRGSGVESGKGRSAEGVLPFARACLAFGLRRLQHCVQKIVEDVFGGFIEGDAGLLEHGSVGCRLGAFREQSRLQRLHEHRRRGLAGTRKPLCGEIERDLGFLAVGEMQWLLGGEIRDGGVGAHRPTGSAHRRLRAIHLSKESSPAAPR